MTPARPGALKMADPYTDAYCQRMSEFSPRLWERLDGVPELPQDIPLDVVKYLLQLACQPSHITPILLGRRSLVRLPRQWLLERLESAAAAVLDLNDDWEYRRFIEVCCFLDIELAERLCERGQASERPAIREAAEQLRGSCQKFADEHAASAARPPC
jgi:hypothetical protein